jgi:hypothetical protein
MADPSPEQGLAPQVYREERGAEELTRFDRLRAARPRVQREVAGTVFARVREMCEALDTAVRSTSRRSVVRAARRGRLPG